jgi:hypothetical protein
MSTAMRYGQQLVEYMHVVAVNAMEHIYCDELQISADCLVVSPVGADQRSLIASAAILGLLVRYTDYAMALVQLVLLQSMGGYHLGVSMRPLG